MAIAFVAASAVATGTGPVSVPTGYATGNLLLITAISIRTVTTPSGWTRIGTGIQTWIYYKFASASESSVTLTGASGDAISFMLCYSGVSALNANGAETTGVPSPATISNVTTTVDNCFLIGVYGQPINPGANTLSTPSGTTLRASNPSLIVVDKLANTAGTYNIGSSTISGMPFSWATQPQAFSPSATVNGNFFFMFN